MYKNRHTQWRLRDTDAWDKVVLQGLQGQKARELGIKTISRGDFLGELTKLYKDTIGILGKDYDDEIKLLKLLSGKKEDEIKNQLKKFSAKDKNNITKLIEEIEFNQLIISDEIMSKLREFIK